MAVADRTEGPLRAKAQRRGLLCLGGVARRAAEVRGIRRAGPLPGGHPRVERLLERGEWLGGPATVAKAKASAAWTLSGSVWVGASLPKGTPAMWPGSHTKKTAKMAIPEGWPMPVLDYYCNIFWQCCPGTSGSRTGWGPCAKISRQGESQKMRKKETRKRGRTSFQQLGTTSNIFQKVGPDNQKRWSAMSIWQQVLGDVGVTTLQIASGFKLHQSEGESLSGKRKTPKFRSGAG